MYEEQEIIQETPDIVEQPSQPTAESIAQEKQEANFRAMREKNKQLERERDAALRLIEEEKLRARYSQQPQQAEPDLADDDIADAGYVKRQLAEVRRELAQEKQRQEEARKQYEQQNALARLSAAYPDYQDVLADRNIDLLRTLEPELMASIDAMPDVYAKGVAAIKAVKAFGVVGHDKYKAEKDAIRQQAAKPKAVNAINASPSNSALNQAHNFTGVMDDAERQRVYLEAVRRSRGQ